MYTLVHTLGLIEPRLEQIIFKFWDYTMYLKYSYIDSHLVFDE